MLIEKLTKEQEAEIPVFIDRYVKKASNPINRDNLKELTKKIWGEEKIVIVGESIQNTIDLIKVAVGGGSIKYETSQLYSQLHSQLDSELDSQLHSQLDSQLRSQLHSQLSSQLHSQLSSQLDSQLDSENISYDYSVSLWWLPWAAYYEYAKYIGVNFDENILNDFIEILNTFSINIFIGNVIFVCERPQALFDNGVLSNDQKMAISWKDGTGFYYLDGVHFKKELWERVVSKEMSLSEIMQIPNADQRTVAIKYNPQAIIKENAELIHSDDRTNELYLVENSEVNELTEYPKMYFLKMTCPTGRVFIEGVPPEIAEGTLNATDCQAWLCGLQRSQYDLMKLES